MAQILPRFCPRCGSPTSGQPICANCGLKIVPSRNDPNAQTMAGYQQTSGPAQKPGSQTIDAPWDDRPASSPPTPKKRSTGRTGCVLVLLLLVVLGTVSYFGAGLLGHHLPGLGNTSQPAITTTPINSTITYAGVDITVLNAQQSESFIDDPNTSTTGMLRLHLQEQNKTNTLVSWVYYDMARLIAPGGINTAPTYVRAKIGVAAGATQTSIVDFAVPINVVVNKMTLRLGTVNEAQMDIPLTGKADLSQYAPKMTNLNRQKSYRGLNWALTDATTGYYIDGHQAAKNMRYITVTLKVDNTLSQIAIIGSPYDYIRLKSGNITATPKVTTLPVSFEIGAMGKTGTVTFLMPQDSTTFTLILLSQSQSGFDQASTDFQLS